MALRAVKPEAVEKRFKAFIFGPPGSRKTTTALQFPAAYLVDAERGAENDQYVKALTAGGGAYMGPDQGATDIDEIIAEVHSLMTEQHPYKTLVIDPITVPYAEACDKAARQLAAEKGEGDGTEFGRHKAVADRKMKRLCGLLLRLPMNVIITSHAKTKWAKVGDSFREEGITFDAYAKLDYLFDLVIETQLRGTEAWAFVRKSRIEAFPVMDSFPLSYAVVAERYGRDVLEKPAEPVQLATPEQVGRLTHLVEVVRLDDAIVQKWLSKADAESFADMPADAVAKCIAYVEAKIETPAATA